MDSPRIVPLDAAHTEAVARLHRAHLRGLLTILGNAAVRAFYDGSVGAPNAAGFVAEHNGAVAGFVLGSITPSTHQRAVAKRKPLAVGAAVVAGIIRRPRALGWLLKSMRGPDEGAYDRSAAELTYITVAPEHRGSGTGRRLVEAFTAAMRAAGATAYELSVDEGNESAAAFYERLGFARIGRYSEFGQYHIRYRLDLA